MASSNSDSKILDNIMGAASGNKKPHDSTKNTAQPGQIPPGIEKLADKMIEKAVPVVIEVFNQKLLAQVADPNSPLITGINDRLATAIDGFDFSGLVMAGVADFLPPVLPEAKQL